MAKSYLSDYSPTPASNTDIDGVDSTGATGRVKDGDNYTRSVMSHLAKFYDDLGAVNTVGGTATAITVTAAEGWTAYGSSANQIDTGTILAIKTGSAATGAATLNVNGIGAKAIRGQGDVAIQANDWIAGSILLLRYDASFNGAAGAWVLLNPASITAVRRQIFTSSGTYTPDATMVYALIECWGSGGAGGGVVGSATGTRGGGGGGAGGYSASIKTAAQVGASQTVTIGAGGTGSSAATGGNGGATSVGSLVVANGGSGGGLNDGSTGFGTAGAGGAVGTGDDARLGGPGFPGNYATITTVMAMGGQGGGPGGGAGRISLSSAGAGNNANVAGGGSGGAANASSSSVAGGSGGGGIVVITEYCVF